MFQSPEGNRCFLKTHSYFKKKCCQPPPASSCNLFTFQEFIQLSWAGARGCNLSSNYTLCQTHLDNNGDKRFQTILLHPLLESVLGALLASQSVTVSAHENEWWAEMSNSWTTLHKLSAPVSRGCDCASLDGYPNWTFLNFSNICLVF